MANENIQELKFQVGEAWKGVYSSSTPYSLANVVQDSTGLSIYRSLKSGNVGHPVTDNAWWFRIIDMSSIKAESDRIKALNDAIAEDEALRVAAEELRQQKEAERIAAETQRDEAEQARISAEQQRVTKETQREANEQQRISAEQGRVNAESARVQTEQARVLAETLRANAEDQRAANEQNRLAAEQQRIERAEQDHQRAESDHATYVDSLGAFDISSYHATDGVLAKYADLTAALGTGGANIPDDLRKGGMSVKFVQSSDNKYVQYRLMSNSFNTTVANWQGVDDEPTAGSENLVTSGSVFAAIRGIHWQSIKGNGETFVWSDGVDVIAGNTYRCVLKNKNVDMTGVTTGGRFVVNTAKDFSNPLVYIPFGTSLSDYYDITIPDNVNTIYFGCRCAINEDFDVLFVDTTIIKSLSNNVLTVAAYDSSDVAKANADIVATALNKGTNAINLAISLLTNGGRIFLRDGHYNGDTAVNINTNNIVIEGESLGAVINNISGNGIVISNGNTGKILKTLTVNAVNGTPMYYDNVVVGTVLKHTKGSSYDFIIAASDSSDYLKSVADYICDGTADDVEINTAIGLLTNGGAIRLCDGTYNVASQIIIEHSNITIIGGGQGTVINSIIAGTNTVILTQNNSNNVFVKDINLGAKFTSLANSGSGYVVNCTVGGKLVAISPWPDRSLLSSYNYVIAASDAPNEFKKIATEICTGTGDDTIIYNYISGLTNGGAILLSPGTFHLNSYIALRKSGVMLCGCGFATKIERSSVLALRVTENAINTAVKDINFGSHTIELEYGSGYGYAYNCWFNGQHYHNYPEQDNSVYVAPSQGIDGINAAIRNFALKGVGGKIKLGIGEYGGSDGIRTQFYIDSSTGTVYANGVEIEGCGYSTYINRNSVNNTFIFTGTINEDRLKFSNMRIKNLIVPTNTITIDKDIKFNDVWIGDKYYQEYNIFFTPVMSIGEDYAIKTFYEFVRHFSSAALLPNEVHLYGVQTFTDIAVLNNIGNIKFVGHNAHLILKPTNGNIQFSLASNGCVFEDIVFEKRGCSNYWNIPCFTINANVYDATFINCKFINNSSSPTPFNPAEASVGDESYVGGRRHGIYIDSAYYGEDCKVAFYNCVGQGSPYGHQNTRGWYISYGEPKLYNCIGYGGGVGEYGHGIVCHRNSKPMLFNFVGYAGDKSYRMAAGIRTQAGGSPTMISCVGYGGCHLQYKSEGVPYSTLHDRCVEIGISDESFFYDGSTVNYSGLTLVSPDDGHNEDRTKLLAVLDSDDVVITSLGTNSYKNYGIGLWYGQQKFKMINCIGYAGGGENSCGLIMEGKNIPTIVGGYFGIEDLSDDVTYINDAGHNYMTFLPDGLNTLTPYTVTGAVVIRGTYPFVEGDKIHIETDEATPKVICDSPYTSNNILPLDVTPTNVDAGVKLKVYVVNNGVIKSVADSGFGFKLTYNYNGLNIRALSVGADAKPKITGCHFETNAASPVIEALCSNDEYSISNCTVVSRGNEDAVVQGQDASDVRMFACVIKGTVDSSITFAQTESVNNSSNIKVI